MSKYIIKNCPAIVISNFNTHLPYCVDNALNSNCKDCTDCLLKQIVELCKDNEKYGGEYYTNPILELLDIQEVD